MTASFDRRPGASPTWCPVCGQAVPGAPGGGVVARGCPNRWCGRADRGFSVVWAVAAHSGTLRGAIVRYKYRGQRALAPAFARTVATYLSAHPTWFEEFDVITAVPGYRGPGARRAWDPVGTVLAELAPLVAGRWAVEPGLVTKTAETPGMAGLGWTARQAVARGPLRRALAVPPSAGVDGSSVLVFDDVMTEGGTLHEVASALRRAGASDVAGLVLARPQWTSPAYSPRGAAG